MYRIISLLILLGLSQKDFGQTTIKGPQCAMAGMEYQYFIFSDIDSNTSMEICVKGGTLVDGNTSCQTTKPVSSIKLRWDGTNSEGAIAIKTNAGSTVLNINITTPLNGGRIDTTVRSQFVEYNSLAVLIKCSPSTGGSCNPVYAYQWQQSDNSLKWIDIPGSADQNLKLATAQKQSLYFRRRTTEKNSGTIEYSDVSAVYVNPKANP